ncbi:adhesion G protein-coupled receptor L3-like isoform X2 [Physella acuta]|uniref:adhesion G protein-coupled receptor L3-like isoform X2 n=1 Tax=Physella acuta TaxID=109671 RepID=UPI0027DCAF3F|nr:adhesion G protein-coupled receptor L3-like isoform X2 [Physella acuta]
MEQLIKIILLTSLMTSLCQTKATEFCKGIDIDQVQLNGQTWCIKYDKRLRTFDRANAECNKFTGGPNNSLRGHLVEIFSQEDNHVIRSFIHKQKKKDPLSGPEFRAFIGLYHKNNTYKWVNSTQEPTYFDAGDPSYSGSDESMPTDGINKGSDWQPDGPVVITETDWKIYDTNSTTFVCQVPPNTSMSIACTDKEEGSSGTLFEATLTSPDILNFRQQDLSQNGRIIVVRRNGHVIRDNLTVNKDTVTVKVMCDKCSLADEGRYVINVSTVFRWNNFEETCDLTVYPRKQCPTDLRATNISFETATLTWSQAISHGKTMRYNIELRSIHGQLVNNWTVNSASNSLISHQIMSLESDTSYLVSVYPTNIFGALNCTPVKLRTDNKNRLSEVNVDRLETSLANYTLEKLTNSSTDLSFVVNSKADDVINQTINRKIMSSGVRLLVQFISTTSQAVKASKTGVDETMLQKLATVTDISLKAEPAEWVSHDGEQTATQLLVGMENMAKAAMNRNIDTFIVRDSLVIKINESNTDIRFPEEEDVKTTSSSMGHNFWLSQSRNSLFLPHNAIAGSTGPKSYSVIVYNDIANKIKVDPDKQRESNEGKELYEKEIVSDVTSFSIRGFNGTFAIPLQMNFSINASNHRNPSCAFLDTLVSGQGVWSTRGCHVIYADQERVTCGFNHTTNFAVLMSPYAAVHQHNYVLDLISKLCCAISIFFLATTVIIYAILWRYVKSDRAILYVNLSVFLALGYIVFLVGVTKTENKLVCTIIAAVLHFLFLVVFFSMLGQGLVVLKCATSVTSRSIIRPVLALTYAGPLVIVAVSLGVTQGQGYGTNDYCWLSIESGLFWAFAGPASLIILLNFIFVLIVLKAMQSSQFMSNKNLTERTKSVVRSICILSPILGLSWVFGVLSMTDPHVIFQYLFAVTNALQGFFIFIFQCLLQHQVKDGLKSIRRRHRAHRLDSSFLNGTFSVTHPSTTTTSNGKSFTNSATTSY